jgi:hypothetical protein
MRERLLLEAKSSLEGMTPFIRKVYIHKNGIHSEAKCSSEEKSSPRRSKCTWKKGVHSKKIVNFEEQGFFRTK